MKIGRWAIALLWLAVVASALGVVYVRGHSRNLFYEFERLTQQRDEHNIEWGRLQLEQATLAEHGRIEQRARQELALTFPDPQHVVVLKP